MTGSVFRIFFPIALGLSALLLVSYINDQQILRGGLNVVPEQLAEDVARELANSGAVYAPTEKIPIESSLAPYVVVYDSFGKPISGTGYLNGALPTIPAGIFDVARSSGEDAVTWQPQSDVRSAIVVVPVRGGMGGYVLGGQSLRFVEREESLLTKRAALGWVAVMLAALFGSLVAARFARR
jgi:hypothetical protein